MKTSKNTTIKNFLLIFGIITIIIGIAGIFSGNITGNLIYDSPISAPYKKIIIDTPPTHVVIGDEATNFPHMVAKIDSQEMVDEFDKFPYIKTDKGIDDSRKFVKFTAKITYEDKDLMLTDYYDLSVKPVCGNGVVEEGEECDDGNIIDGDGCDSDCNLEEETLSENGDSLSGGGGATLTETCASNNCQYCLTRESCESVDGDCVWDNTRCVSAPPIKKPIEEPAIEEPTPAKEPVIITPAPVEEPEPTVGQAIGIARWNSLWLILVILGTVAIVLYLILFHKHIEPVAKRKKSK